MRHWIVHSEQKHIKLTRYSHGSGCGCKIAPRVLEEILLEKSRSKKYPGLLVGYETRDDAAVYDIGNGEALISTTDFFMPVVDNPFDFGYIAAVNAISDVYAMGGTPLMAISVLGWPVNKLSPSIAKMVVEGGRAACLSAGIPLAGGHSIDNPEPVFGLAVTGKIKIKHLKRNSTALPGCELYLSKPLGVGIMTTALKKGLLRKADKNMLVEQMKILNRAGEMLAKINAVKAMTDVTGFGLLGHLIEMCEASGVNAILDFEKIPLMKNVDKYISLHSIPGGTNRNWDSYGHKVSGISEYQKKILCDPQTSGGLLVAVEKSDRKYLKSITSKMGTSFYSIGQLVDSPTNLSKNIIAI